MNENSNKNYECKICSYKNISEKKYNNHLKTKKHINKERILLSKKIKQKCRMCDFESSDKNILQNHTKTHPNYNATYKCEACNVYIANQSSLNKHCIKKTHGDNVREKYPDALKGGIKINDKLISYARIDLSKKHLYIKTLREVKSIKKTNENKTNKIIKIKTDNKNCKNVFFKEYHNCLTKNNIGPKYNTNLNNNFILNVSEYLDYYNLDSDRKKKLINKFYLWLEKNGINPEDEGYTSFKNNEIDDVYINVYNFVKNNPIEYLKNFHNKDVKYLIQDKPNDKNTNDITLNIEDYKEYYNLDDKKKDYLIQNFYKWLYQQNINPTDEGLEVNYDKSEINEVYISVYSYVKDDIKTYFKNIYDIDVNNIIVEKKCETNNYIDNDYIIDDFPDFENDNNIINETSNNDDNYELGQEYEKQLLNAANAFFRHYNNDHKKKSEMIQKIIETSKLNNQKLI